MARESGMVMTSGENNGGKLRLGKMLPLIGIIIAAVLAWWQFGDLLSFQALADNREALINWRDSNYTIAVAVFLLIYIGAVSFSVPGAVFLSLGAGFLFGLPVGTLMVVFAATTGATVIFLAAKTGLGDALHAKMMRNGDGVIAKMEKGLRENEISYLFIMRLVPAVPFFVANLAPAFLGVKLRNYIIATFFGIMPGTMVFVWIGSGLGEVFARGETPNLGIIFEWQILGPMLALAVLSTLPIIIKFFRKAKA